MPAERVLTSPEAESVLEMAREFARSELAPRAAADEERGAFPRDVYARLGELGLLAMPYPEAVGGAGLDYEIYLQVLEEIAAAWASVAVGVSVHVMSCYPLFHYGSDAQRERWLGEMLSGRLLGAYCLSEAHAGSDAAAMSTRARADGDRLVLTGTKAWVTHG